MFYVELNADDVTDLAKFITTGNIADALFTLEKMAAESDDPQFSNAVSLGRYNSQTAKIRSS